MIIPISEYRDHIRKICDKAKYDDYVCKQFEEIKGYWKKEELHIINGYWISPCMFGPGVNKSLSTIDS